MIGSMPTGGSSRNATDPKGWGRSWLLSRRGAWGGCMPFTARRCEFICSARVITRRSPSLVPISNYQRRDQSTSDAMSLFQTRRACGRCRRDADRCRMCHPEGSGRDCARRMPVNAVAPGAFASGIPLVRRKTDEPQTATVAGLARCGEYCDAKKSPRSWYRITTGECKNVIDELISSF